MSSQSERGLVPLEQQSPQDLEQALVQQGRRLNSIGINTPLGTIIQQAVIGAKQGLEGYEQLESSTGSLLLTAHNIELTIDLGHPDYIHGLQAEEYDKFKLTIPEISRIWNRLNALSRNEGKGEYQLPKELILPFPR